jgi:hypothetical protein
MRNDLQSYGGINDVTLMWGDAKKGILHIGNRRGEQVVADVLLTVALGDISKQVSGKKTVHLEFENTEAVLSLDEHGQQ